MSQRTRLIRQVGSGLADLDGDLRDQVPTWGMGAVAPSDAGHCMTHRSKAFPLGLWAGLAKGKEALLSGPRLRFFLGPQWITDAFSQ